VKALTAIRERKRIVETGEWTHGKMPRTAFPLSKSHSFALGSAWSWAVWRLAADGRHYKVLVALEPGKQQYQAWLGFESGADQALLARLEYHPSHRGWHCHVKKGELEDVGLGVVKHPNSREMVRLCKDENFEITLLNAFGLACQVFNIVPSGSGLFQ
jgi:hypothetical protein